MNAFLRIAVFFTLLLLFQGTVSAQRMIQKAFQEIGGVSTGTHGDIKSFSDGSIVLLIERFTNFSQKGFQLVHLNKDLERLKSASFFDNYTLRNIQIQVKNDTVYLACSVDNESSSNILFASFDKNLDLINAKVLESNLNYNLYRFMIHPHGGFAAVGFIIGTTSGQGGTVTGNVGNMCMRFSENGNILWCRRLGYASVSFGSANVLDNGDIVSSGGSIFWSINANGDLNWTSRIDGFDLIQSHQVIGNTLFFVPTNYKIDDKQILRLETNGKFIGVTQAINIGKVQFSGVMGKELMVASSVIKADSAFLQLSYLGEDGKLNKQTLFNNHFGLLGPNNTEDICRYSYHLALDGTPYILGVAYRKGYEVFKLDYTGRLGCMDTLHSFKVGPQAAPSTYSLSLTEHQTGFIPFIISSEPAVNYSELIVCDNCVAIDYRLPNDTILCDGQSIQIQIPSGILKVKWSDGSTALNRKLQDSGQYICTLYSTCDSISDTLNIKVLKVPEITLNYLPINPLPKEEVFFTSSPNNLLKYEWIFEDSIYSTSSTWNHIFPKNGRFKIVLRGYNSICFKADSVELDVFLIDWYLPNAFTPNNDNINELWGPVGTGLQTYNLKIFSRWGELIFDEDNEFWDGKHKGKILIDGLYLYYLTGLDDEGEKVLKKGTITLLN